MRTSDEVRVGAGFFSSRCLAQIAPGLATFLNDTQGTIHLMVSPEISDEDRDAIRKGVSEPEVVLQETIERLFVGARLSKSAVERHVVDTLAYLVASGRLNIRVVLMEKGMYHKKIWLFRSGDNWLAVHGSGNATERGLLVNGEHMSIDRTWMDGRRSKERVEIFLKQWEIQWSNRSPTSLTVNVDQVIELLGSYAGSAPPTITDFWDSWRSDCQSGLEPDLPPTQQGDQVESRLRIPQDLIWKTDRFAHQGAAVDALLSRKGGIISMATGGGKTRTALIATSEMQSKMDHLCVVVLAPTRPLIRQWAADVREFGIDPVILSGIGAHDRLKQLERISLAFETRQPRTVVLLLTHTLFSRSDSPIKAWLQSLPATVNRLLIADEVHNLGAPSFLNDLPSFFEYRIGLSATPIRQYDPDGTDRLFNFFGGLPVFEFSLGDAIKAGCLVPYSYYLHEVEFGIDEMAKYDELTQQLARAGFRVDDDGRTIGLTKRVEGLLRKRRAIVEQADGKLGALERELRRLGPESISRTLIYTSSKPIADGKPRQITAVNRILQRLNIISHQFTSEETQSGHPESILERFGSGEYQVLTSMKVLDEGINIPQTNTAFILASSTVEREWVQRRGRILRTAPEKTVAHLQDFIVVPLDLARPEAKSLLSSELRRARAFADLAENEHDPDGPNNVIRDLESRIWRY